MKTIIDYIFSLLEDSLNTFEKILQEIYTKIKDFAKNYTFSSTFILFLIILLLPFLFTRSCSWTPDFSDSGQIGDTFGIMNPFIAIVAAILTFIAFWTQYQANKKMLEKDEKQEVVHQFFEMLQIHKENVKELTWEQWRILESRSPTSKLEQSTTTTDQENKYGYHLITGRKVFEHHQKEFNSIQHYFIAAIKYIQEKKICNINFDITNLEDFLKIIQISYLTYLNGLTTVKKFFRKKHTFIELCESNLKEAYEIIQSGNFSKILENDKCNETFWNDDQGFALLFFYYNLCCVKENMEIYSTDSKGKRDMSGSILYKGHYSELNHYYRHLYQMVKIVANYDEKIVTYKEKRKYLKMLRAQLTSDEQALLFYNWLSGYGSDWENKKNHFFTKYRMIHNLKPESMKIFNNVNSKKIIQMIKDTNPGYNEYENDNLFEFEDKMN